ncbi:MAG: hypothetical protein HY959_10805 [Ignavibacteriae bacterium]|nr:hypothetical protein [Ignavibacteriota bacterium]
MIRFIFYIILTYIIFFILKFILKIFRKSKSINPNPPTNVAGENKEQLDKSKIVDADFEEIK